MEDLDSNTSHVIVYPLPAKGSPAASADSNTSHVIVYRQRRHGHRFCGLIQIHLMLLFIHENRPAGDRGVIQIHLMLLFIVALLALPS